MIPRTRRYPMRPIIRRLTPDELLNRMLYDWKRPAVVGRSPLDHYRDQVRTRAAQEARTAPRHVETHPHCPEIENAVPNPTEDTPA